jgi:hypothetical protein
MTPRYWMILPNGARQLIDPLRFDLASVEERARRIGGRLELEVATTDDRYAVLVPAPSVVRAYEPPIAAVGPLFRTRLERVHQCLADYELDINARATTRVLGGYYRRRRLVRVYSHDRKTGRRPMEELFDTFLHEVSHHLEYTEPDTFNGTRCGRVPGRMHSALFWQIFSELKRRWAHDQAKRP